MIVLDTNVVSELLRPKPSPIVAEWASAQRASSLRLTATVVAELLSGVAQLPGGRRRTGLQAAVGELVSEFGSERLLAFDLEAARAYAEIRASRRRAGRPISLGDAQIAAVCLVHEATLATRNVADFDLCGIRVLDPWGRLPRD